MEINKLSKLKKLGTDKLSQITSLVITEELNEKSFKYLLEILPRLSSLKELTINNQKQKRDFVDLFIVLPKCPDLYLLNLADNFITRKDFEILASQLPSFSCIGVIILDDNKLADLNEMTEEEFNLVLSNIGQSKTIHRLELSNNYIDLSKIFAIKKIVELNVAHTEKLFAAAAAGDIKTFELSVKMGNKINTQFIFPPSNVLQTCMHVAAYYGHLNILKFLIKHGAQIVPDGNGFTPLQLVEAKLASMEESRNAVKDYRNNSIKIGDYVKLRFNLMGVASFLGQKPLVRAASCYISRNALFQVKSNYTGPSKPPKVKLKEELIDSSETRIKPSMKS